MSLTLFIKNNLDNESRVQMNCTNGVVYSAGTRYSALEELREGSGGVYLGWSNHVLGAGPFAWSEHMKVAPH